MVPADDFPSASEVGGLRFWSQVTASERPEWADRAIAVLDLLDRQSGGRFADLDADARQAVLDSLVNDPEYVWFAHLVNAGFYADPDNGGNDDGASWRMLGWSPAPPAAGPQRMSGSRTAARSSVPIRWPRTTTPWWWVRVLVAGWRRGRWRSPAGRSCWWSGATTRTRPTWLAITCATPAPTAGWTIGRCARRRRIRAPSCCWA